MLKYCKAGQVDRRWQIPSLSRARIRSTDRPRMVTRMRRRILGTYPFAISYYAWTNSVYEKIVNIRTNSTSLVDRTQKASFIMEGFIEFGASNDIATPAPPRRTRRSKGCGTCRRRKVKCGMPFKNTDEAIIKLHSPHSLTCENR